MLQGQAREATKLPSEPRHLYQPIGFPYGYLVANESPLKLKASKPSNCIKELQRWAGALKQIRQALLK